MSLTTATVPWKVYWLHLPYKKKNRGLRFHFESKRGFAILISIRCGMKYEYLFELGLVPLPKDGAEGSVSNM